MLVFGWFSNRLSIVAAKYGLFVRLDGDRQHHYVRPSSDLGWQLRNRGFHSNELSLQEDGRPYDQHSGQRNAPHRKHISTISKRSLQLDNEIRFLAWDLSLSCDRVINDRLMTIRFLTSNKFISLKPNMKRNVDEFIGNCWNDDDDDSEWCFRLKSNNLNGISNQTLMICLQSDHSNLTKSWFCFVFT